MVKHDVVLSDNVVKQMGILQLIIGVKLKHNRLWFSSEGEWHFSEGKFNTNEDQATNIKPIFPVLFLSCNKVPLLDYM